MSISNHSASASTPSTAPPPRRVALIVTAGVVLATLALITWSLGPVLRPAERVEVVQAVFDTSVRSTDDAPATPSIVGVAATASFNPDANRPTVQAPGWLEADPFYTAAAALTDGVIESVDVLEGEAVERGQIIARLVKDDAQLALRLAEANFAAAQSARDRAAAEHAAARRNWEEPFELVRAVEVGWASLHEREAELAQLPTQIESAQAVLTRLEEETKRVRSSSARGATSEFELIAAQQREIAQRAELETLRAREPLLQARVERLRAELRAAERGLELRIEDRRRLDTAEAALTLAEADIARAAAARDTAALALERTDVRAPIGGIVQRRLKIPGDKVGRQVDDRESLHIVHLYNPDDLQVRVDVPLADAAHVRVGQRCEVIVEVLPERVFEGVVTRTTHEADLQKNTLQFKVRVIAPDPVLRPEMLTRVKFLGGKPTGSASSERPASDTTAGSAVRATTRVRVPISALAEPAEPGDTARLWIITSRKDGRGTLAPRDVKILENADGWTHVEGDLQPGALIAVDPEYPRAGQPVAFQSSNDRSIPGGTS